MLTIWKKLRNRFRKKERTEFKVFLLIKFSGLCLLKNYNNRDVLLDTTQSVRFCNPFKRSFCGCRALLIKHFQSLPAQLSPLLVYLKEHLKVFWKSKMTLLLFFHKEFKVQIHGLREVSTA